MGSNDERRRDLRAGLAGLVALLVLLGGVPAALWALAGWPLPTALPSWSAFTDGLGSSYVPDTFLTKALALVCWLVWFELVASVLVEAIALARGRRAAAVPLAGPVQRMAGRLVAAVALLTVLAAARPEEAEQLVRPLLPSTPATPAVLDLGDVAPAQPAPAAPALPTYTVVPRDSLWEIAERHLHDGLRWTEIWELNRDRAQPDGAVLRDADLIRPGWQLLLPADAVGFAPAAAPVPEPVVERLVPVPGDDGPRVVLTGNGTGATEVLVPVDGPAPGPAVDVAAADDATQGRAGG